MLVIDELGYLPVDQLPANWISQVVSRCYDRGTVVLTSNRSFSDWSQVLPTKWPRKALWTGCSTVPPCSRFGAAATACVPTKNPPAPREVVPIEAPLAPTLTGAFRSRPGIGCSNSGKIFTRCRPSLNEISTG